MNSEMYYLLGSPSDLKQSLVSVLRKSVSEYSDILIPEVFTTNKALAEGDNYTYIDKRNFLLRQSINLYSLSWEKKGELFGINGDLSQRLASGCDVLLNGSMLNLQQAKQSYSNLNVILIKKAHPGDLYPLNNDNYLIAEDDEVTLEWSSQDANLGYPYILTLMSDHCIENAIEMILSLILYNRNNLEYAG